MREFVLGLVIGAGLISMGLWAYNIWTWYIFWRNR